MPRKLRIWNGRGYDCINHKDPRWKDIPYNKSCHAYICAYSIADACRVIGEYTGTPGRPSELKNYFSEAWGISMDGITPERGLWIAFKDGQPTRVV